MTLGQSIRRAQIEDREPVLGIIRAAFDPERVDTIVKALWRDEAVKFEYLTELGGTVIGYCAFTAIELKPPFDGLALQLSPVAVAPDHQRKGIGTELTHHALDQCRKAGASLIAVLGHPNYYRRFGFTPAHEKNVGWGGRDVGDALQIIDYDNSLSGAPCDITMHPAFTDK